MLTNSSQGENLDLPQFSSNLQLLHRLEQGNSQQQFEENREMLLSPTNKPPLPSNIYRRRSFALKRGSANLELLLLPPMKISVETARLIGRKINFRLREKGVEPDVVISQVSIIL